MKYSRFNKIKSFSTAGTVHDLLSKVVANTELSFHSLRTRLTPSYWFAILVANLAAWGFEQNYANAAFNTLYFRLFVCVVGIPLFLRPFPRTTLLKRFQSLYFIGFMTLLFPLLFSWNALANASFTASTEGLSGAWLTEYALAVFIYMGLYSKPMIGMVISFMSLVFAALVSNTLYNPEGDAFLGTILFMVATIITVFGFLLTTHQQLNYVLQHRLETAYSIGSRVAHELRTPLLSIRNFAATAKLANSRLESGEDEEIRSTLDHVLKEVEFANKTIDILLVSTRKAPFEFQADTDFSALAAVSRAVRSYPYANSSERDCIRFGKLEDFKAHGPIDLVIHALYNLIKNALLSASSYTAAEIEVSCRKSKDARKGLITVTDNGRGVPAGLRTRVFEDFFTTRSTGDGTGLGLPFCRSLMTQLGGKITYRRDRQLSVFEMTFPL